VSLRIDGATVVDPAPESPRVREDVSIHVDEGCVRSIGDARPEAERVLSADGDLVLPGLVNAHGHAPMTLLRGYADDLGLERWLEQAVWPVEAHLEREHVLAGARLAVAEMLAAGVTGFADMYLFEDAVAQAADEAGLACLAGASIVDQPTAEGRPEEVMANAEALLADHDPTQGRVRGSLAPHAVYTCGPETLATVADLAETHEARIQVHVAETMGEVYEAEADHGRRPVAHLDEHGCLTEHAIFAHCGWMTRAEGRQVAEAGASVAHCPTANQKLATGGTTPVPELVEAGAAVAVGTDGPASNNRIDVLQEAKRAALLHKHHRWRADVVPAEQALAMATREAAFALGFEQAGRVREGAWADLAVIDVDQPHLRPMHDPVSQVVYAARGGDVRATIVDGQLAYEEGRYPGLDVEAVVDEAERAAADLVSKAETHGGT
jgi:5-methylthioadenosine/S-adenosylhomocysteine deaminase